MTIQEFCSKMIAESNR